jgi:PAS domain S-box-containing protein
VNDKLSWSDEVYRIFGLEPKKFGATYEAFLEAVHSDDRKMVDDAYSSSLQVGSGGYEIDHRVVRKSTGEVRFVHEKCEHIRDESGEVVRSIGFVQDETEKKLLEDKLISSLERLNKSEKEMFAMNEEMAAVNEELTVWGEELRKSREDLEERIKERTSDLSNMNERLMAEIEERKRIEQSLRVEEARLDALLRLSRMSEAPLEEIASYTLEQAITLTESKIGFVGLLNEDESVYTLHAVSKGVVKECNVTSIPMQWHVAEAGVWADAIRQRRTLFVNDYSKPYPSKKGLPPGHPYVKKFMVVPILVDGRIAALAGVGNKVSDYNEFDERQVALLLSGMWGYLDRKLSVERLQQAKDELEEKVKQRTVELRSLNEQLQASERELQKYSSQLEEMVQARTREIVDVRERLESFMNNATEAFFIYDQDLRLVDMNPAALTLYSAETRRENLLGRDIVEVAPGIEKTPM